MREFLEVFCNWKNGVLLVLALTGFSYDCASTENRTVDQHRNPASESNEKNRAADREWRYYGGDAGSSKFSTLNRINAKNVKSLKTAWTWTSPDGPIVTQNNLPTGLFEATPLMVQGTLFVSTSLSQVAAIDPESGKTRWIYDPESYRQGIPGNFGFVHRGVAYWSDGNSQRILYGTGDAYLISLDAENGKPDPAFGSKGKIDLTQGLSRSVKRSHYGESSPPIICGSTIIVGSSIPDVVFKQPTPPGDVRGFDVKTGKLKWTFHTIPQAGEPEAETWEQSSWKKTGNANVWAPMSADQNLGAVYLPISTPANDYYGGERPGNGLYGDSLVSLSCETGKKNWHFQLVHHGLWDYDPPAAPILFDAVVDGKPIKAVAEVTKQAFVYVFDRVSGQPVWPIVERPVPASDVPFEQASKTQPMPTKPAPFDYQGIRDEDLIDFTPALKDKAREIVGKYVTGPLFTPPSLKGTLTAPGTFGGANWAGAAYSPVTGMLYVPSYTHPVATQLTKTIPALYDYKYTINFKGSGFPEGPEGLPLLKPPYGRITAISMKSGEHAWMAPIGRGPRDNPALTGVELPSGDLGWDRRTHVLATPELLFAAQGGKFALSTPIGLPLDFRGANLSQQSDDPMLRALDPVTGKTLAKIQLPWSPYGAPMTYEWKGKQYVVVPVGGGKEGAFLIALALEDGDLSAK
jgi:quinoprotein glucose dehydrogenase